MILDCPRGQVSFGARVLNTGVNFIVDRITMQDTPAMELPVYPLAAREGSALAGPGRLAAKTIQVQGRVLARSASSRQTLLDRLNRDLTKDQQQLKVGIADGRYYLANLQGQVQHDFVEDRKQETPYTVNFFAPDPLAFAEDQGSVSNNSALVLISGTTYRKTFDITPLGNIFARPRIQITIPAATAYGVSEIYVSILGREVGMISPTTFAASDVFIWDSYTFESLKNGLDFDLVGQFPLLDPRGVMPNVITVTAEATSAPTLHCLITWYPRWLN